MCILGSSVLNIPKISPNQLSKNWTWLFSAKPIQSVICHWKHNNSSLVLWKKYCWSSLLKHKRIDSTITFSSHKRWCNIFYAFQLLRERFAGLQASGRVADGSDMYAQREGQCARAREREWIGGSETVWIEAHWLPLGAHTMVCHGRAACVVYAIEKHTHARHARCLPEA